MEKLEVTGTIAGETLAIHFRNNISGITQKLGELVLKRDDTQEIDSISWAGTAVLRSTELETEVRSLTSKYDEQSKTVEKLNKQLEDLILAKQQHEDALLQKFCELLNAKKLKIRDQQRLLAGATVDPKSAAKVQSTRQTSKTRSPPAPRAGKRKAKAVAAADSSSEEDSFEPKAPTQTSQRSQNRSNALDKEHEVSDASEQVNTPDATDQDATEDESDDDLDSAPQPTSLTDRGKGRDAAIADAAEMEIDEPPPDRALPFGSAGSEIGKEKAAKPEVEDHSKLNREAGNEDEETDDDDDEL